MILEFKWTVSHARDTYGYNICTLYVDDKKVARCNGGGYDMEGTVLGAWMEKTYQDRLRGLDPKNFHGLFPASCPPIPRVCLDGACGIESMIAIGEAIGLTFHRVPLQSKKQTIYEVTDWNARTGLQPTSQADRAV